VTTKNRVEMKTSEADRAYEDLGFKPNMKYGPRSDLRKECSRFLRFAYLLDFVTMDALTNIYLNSVQFLFDKLEGLSNVEIKYEFDASKSQFGESKRPIYTGPEPLFLVDAEFTEERIRQSDLVEVKVKAFSPPPMGHSTSKDFDPIVHIELEDNPEPDKEDK
jgi:dynein heavy chain, axonemal